MSRPSTAAAAAGSALADALRRSEEEKEREAQDAATKLQRSSRLEAMVQKRKDNFSYLKKMQEGDHFWLNTVLFTRQDLVEFSRVHVSATRVLQFFYLGISLGKLLDLPSGPIAVRAVAQLLEEWEYYFSNTAMQSMKYVMAKSTPHVYPQAGIQQDPDSDQFRPVLYKFNNDVVYEHLHTPHVGFELDYFEVFFSLCDVLSLVYNKFIAEECFSNPNVYEAIVRVDTKVKHYVINLVAKEFTDSAVERIKTEIDDLRSGIVK